MNKTAECPVCGSKIEISPDTVVSELLTCPDCGTELEVASVNPIKLIEAPQEEEDWGE
jgi:alpha-aminoadipate carrier protein LysW